MRGNMRKERQKPTKLSVKGYSKVVCFNMLKYNCMHAYVTILQLCQLYCDKLFLEKVDRPTCIKYFAYGYIWIARLPNHEYE